MECCMFVVGYGDSLAKISALMFALGFTYSGCREFLYSSILSRGGLVGFFDAIFIPLLQPLRSGRRGSGGTVPR